LVSPTCPHCLAGTRVLGDGLGRFPDSDIAVLVLWLPVLPADTEYAAGRAAGDLSIFPSVTQYWAGWPGWEVATALRPVLGLGPADRGKAAWDVYLLYGPETRWLSEPPAPASWAHNLVDKRLPWIPRLSQGIVDRWLTTTTPTGALDDEN
jgi:hypothetical protein